MFGGGSLNATQRVALERAVHLSAEIEIQLRSRENTGPILALLSLAREYAATSMAELAFVRLDDKSAADLQMDVRCFQRIVDWLKHIVDEGFEADRELSMAERYEVSDEILGVAEGDESEDMPEGATE